jgi:hypothetical protein
MEVTLTVVDVIDALDKTSTEVHGDELNGLPCSHWMSTRRNLNRPYVLDPISE